jgi:hypothetical protein
MASTRNRNTQGNYNLEQRNNDLSSSYKLYENSSHGAAYNTNQPGNGLNPGQIPSNKMSHNASDIESFLFGINSTNLVNPAPKIRPDLVWLDSVHLYQKDGVLMPLSLRIAPNQRPKMD